MDNYTDKFNGWLYIPDASKGIEKREKMKDHILKVFESRILSRVFGSTWDENGECRKRGSETFIVGTVH